MKSNRFAAELGESRFQCQFRVDRKYNRANPQIRAEAASYLMSARSTSGVQAALQQATEDPDPTVAAAAQQSLRQRVIDR